MDEPAAPQYKAEWKIFEVEVERAVTSAVGNMTHPNGAPKFRVAFQLSTTHQGAVKRYDVHVAQCRQGGKAVVLDAKHFRNPLPSHEVQTTYKYKTGGRASACAIVASPSTVIPPATQATARQLGVIFIQASSNRDQLINAIRAFILQTLDYEPARASLHTLGEPTDSLSALTAMSKVLAG